MQASLLPPLRGHCLSLLDVQCLENNSPCTLSVSVCWFISGGKVNLVHLSYLEAEDMLLQFLFNCIHEPLKSLALPLLTGEEGEVQTIT